MANEVEIETKRLRREVMVQLIRAFFSENFEEEIERIPENIFPDGNKEHRRESLEQARAIVREQIIADLGFSVTKEGQSIPLKEYASMAKGREKSEDYPLTMLNTACHACPKSRIYTTDLCQGCVARPCLHACKFNAISFENGHSVIDPDQCKKCGMCVQACPYQAIAKTIVPCEHACPVDALEKDEEGKEHHIEDKCITCGKCVSACPFGAPTAKSQIIDVLMAIKAGHHPVVAMIAPAAVGHFSGKPEQLKALFSKLGFAAVYEVAQGAEMTIATEAHDLKERLDRGDPFMTTSCCAAYNEWVKRYAPDMKPFVSDAKTPLQYTAEIVKAQMPEAVTVFISPCFAKRKEAMEDANVHWVVTIEEWMAWMVASGALSEEGNEDLFLPKTSQEAREFALTGGVARAVQAAWEGDPDEIKPVVINGLDKLSIRNLRGYSKSQQCPLGNLIEVMNCPGGCVGGDAGWAPLRLASNKVKSYGKEGKSLKKENNSDE